jgi:FkbM family methyltransferase
MQKINQILTRCYEAIFTFFDSRSQIATSEEKTLFIDLGANKGQSFRHFAKFYKNPNIKFELFEPNSNCIPYLKNIKEESERDIEIIEKGAWIENGHEKLFGTAENEGGATSQGASINKSYISNWDWYDAESTNANTVEVIDFSEYLEKKRRNYKNIIVKMDIEGAEIEVLRKIIDNGNVNAINILYVEFHSKLLHGERKYKFSESEREIRDHLKKASTRVRIWH